MRQLQRRKMAIGPSKKVHRPASSTEEVRRPVHRCGTMPGTTFVHFKNGREKLRFGNCRFLHIFPQTRLQCFCMSPCGEKRKRNLNGVNFQRSINRTVYNTLSILWSNHWWLVPFTWSENTCMSMSMCKGPMARRSGVSAIDTAVSREAYTLLESQSMQCTTVRAGEQGFWTDFVSTWINKDSFWWRVVNLWSLMWFVKQHRSNFLTTVRLPWWSTRRSLRAARTTNLDKVPKATTMAKAAASTRTSTATGKWKVVAVVVESRPSIDPTLPTSPRPSLKSQTMRLSMTRSLKRPMMMAKEMKRLRRPTMSKTMMVQKMKMTMV